MSNSNLYATLAEYKAYATARGQTASTDAADDAVVVDLLEDASRYLDDKTRRQFYPSIETRVYDVPRDSLLSLDEDLLSVITLTNGDTVAISSDDYMLHPANISPYFAISLRDTSSVSWQASSAGSYQRVISLLAWWGYREHFAQRAWSLAGTLGAAITDAAATSFTMTAGHTLTAGHIIKVGSEIMNVSSVATNTITPIKRGDNGSTAATHLISAPVYIWEPQEEAKNAVLEIANSAYQRRFGKSTGESATVTAAGVVLTPRDIPKMAEEFIRINQRFV